MSTQTYTVHIPVQTSIYISVDAEEGVTPEQIQDAITRQHLMNADSSVFWDDIKDAVRGDVDGWSITDEDGEEIA